MMNKNGRIFLLPGFACLTGMSVSPDLYILNTFFQDQTVTCLAGVPLCLHLLTVIHNFVVISDTFVVFGGFGTPHFGSLSYVG